MKRLAQKNINTGEEYDRIFEVRKGTGVDDFDFKRWHKLLKYFKGGRLIDLGCLDSLIPGIAKEKFPKSEIWGIDIAEQALIEMQRKFPFAYYEKMDVYDTKFPSGYFSYAVAGELIEHLEDPERFFKEAFRILKSGGVMAVSAPFEEHYGDVDSDRHIWSYSIEDIRDLMNPYGSVKIKLMGSQYFPVYRYHHKNIIAYCTKK